MSTFRLVAQLHVANARFEVNDFWLIPSHDGQSSNG
jgi:hypothetical protein